MNLDDQKKTGTNQISVTDSLEAPLLNIKVKRTSSTTVPSGTTNLIVYVDTSPKGSPSANRKQFLFELSSVLGYASNTSDEFVLEVKPKRNDIISSAYVIRRVSGNTVLSTPTTEELDESLITLFEGTNYIYTNYTNDYIELIYPKNDDLNKRYLNNAIFAYHRMNSSGDFSLDDIYFKDAFTKTGNKLNFEIDNAEIESITSKNNTFSLDSNGNLVVNSITTNSGGGSSLDPTAVCNLIYPVGSIYMSVNSTSPSTLFGGTWVQLKDRFLLGAGDTYTNESTGGSAALQSHSHTIPALSGTAASSTHTHTVTTKTTSYGSGSQTAWRCLSWPGTNADFTQTVYTNNGTADGSHTHSVTTVANNTGSAGTGNGANMPPYLTVYMWKRTA